MARVYSCHAGVSWFAIILLALSSFFSQAHSSPFDDALPPMVEWAYGMSNVEQQCSLDYGAKLINQWRSAFDVLCEPMQGKGGLWWTGEDTKAGLPHHAGGGLRAFVMRDVTVDASAINVPQVNGVSGYGGESFRPGAFSSPCQPGHGMQGNAVSSSVTSRLMPAQAHALQGFQAGSNNGPCDVQLNSPLLVMSRDGHLNNYHSFSDFFIAFLGMQLLGKAGTSDNDINILFTDGYPEGPWWGVWQHFVTGKVMSARELQSHGKSKVCSPLVMLPPGSQASPLWEVWKPSPCSYSPLLREFGDVVVGRLGLLDMKPPAGEVHAIIISRKGNTRRINNENEIKALLDGAEGVNAEVVDFEGMDGIEQIKKLRTVSLLVGQHGAGLTHLLFTPKEAALVEFHAKRRDGTQSFLYCFRNIAKWTLRPYFMWRNTQDSAEDGSGNMTVDIDSLTPVLDAAVRTARGFGQGISNCGLQC